MLLKLKIGQKSRNGDLLPQDLFAAFSLYPRVISTTSYPFSTPSNDVKQHKITQKVAGASKGVQLGAIFLAGTRKNFKFSGFVRQRVWDRSSVAKSLSVTRLPRSSIFGNFNVFNGVDNSRGDLKERRKGLGCGRITVCEYEG